jgi:hypothetical protein
MGTCYWCGQFGHFNMDCTAKVGASWQGNALRPFLTMQIHSLVPKESERDTEVVTGTIPIFGFKVSVLFDSGATHSFLSIMFIKLSRLSVRTVEVGLKVATTVGKTVTCSRIARGCPITIKGRTFQANLIVLPLHGYNVILRMDWLAKHFASIDYAHKLVTLKPWGEAEITFVGS